MTALPSAITTRRQLGTTAAFGLVASIIGLALFASATPSPLYGLYQQEWHFSTPVLTLVYAVYCFGVLGALLLVGRISDDVGRRPVLLIALGGLFGAGVLFTVANSVGWLFAARAVQGITTGVVSAAGIGAGAFVSSILVQYGPDQMVTPFIVLLALIAIALAGTMALPEPVAHTSRPRLTPQRPRVPSSIRRPFILSGLGVLSSWSVGGIYLSLGPVLAADLMNTTNHLAGGAAVLAVAGPGAPSPYPWKGVHAPGGGGDWSRGA